MTEGYFKDIYLEDGKARWISNIKGYYFIVNWYKERIHAATYNGRFLGYEQKREISPAGEWFIGICKAGIYGRKSYYNNL